MPRFDGSLTRFEIGEHRERRGQQFVDGRGYGSDHFEDVHRVDPHGFASRPVPGGLMYAIQARGNRDLVFGVGGEFWSLRPQLPVGGSAIYDQWGGILKWVEDGVVLDTKNRTAKFTASDWTIEAPKGVTVKGDLHVEGSITASGTIIDAGGNTPHHQH